jgi:hypothetical protein
MDKLPPGLSKQLIDKLLSQVFDLQPATSFAFPFKSLTEQEPSFLLLFFVFVSIPSIVLARKESSPHLAHCFLKGKRGASMGKLP